MIVSASMHIPTQAQGAYTLPEGNVQIQFSGGRTSAYMLHQILEANGGLPDRAIVAFQNTGREMPQTLDFVHECGERWGVNVIWLEYRPDYPRFEVVLHNSASRDGEPFEALIRKRSFLPNRVARFCTAELKVNCASRYCKSLGWEAWTSAVGIRADEARRIPSKPQKERWQPWHPLFHAGVTKRDVTAFWMRQPFDLRLPNIKGNTSLGNCDGCFLKSEASRAALAREYPERFAWWVRMEAIAQGTFRPAEPYADLSDFIERQGDWLFDETGYLCQADDGECTG
jgi:3'-phosphoadenosine 5'-phosphosulfate sulfotransferase (PAPS reductase)/FAD synthetase